MELRVDVRPAWPFRLATRPWPDGVVRRLGAGVQRVLHVGEEPVHVVAVQLAPDRVRFAARAADELAAGYAIEHMRFATGVDDDLAAFHRLFRHDPVIGLAVRTRPHLRVRRRAEPFEALAWAVCEQLIESERAAAIQRRLVARFGRRCPRTGLLDAPPAAALAAAAPAELEACGLAAARALALRRAAAAVARGRVDLHARDPEPGWRSLRAIPGIGRWTVEVLALEGQGRLDQVPAADLHFLKLVGRLTTGNPRARADEAQARAFFSRYGPWQGLAAHYLLYAGFRGLLPVRDPGGQRRSRAPRASTGGSPSWAAG